MDPEARSADGRPLAGKDLGHTALNIPRRIAGRPGRIALVAIVCAALVGVTVWQASSASHSNDSNHLVGRTGLPAPVFSLPNLVATGRTISLADFRGKPLVINFWASWCIPCRTEMQLLERAHRAAGGQVQFLGIDSNDTAGPAVAFLSQVHVTYPVASNEGGTVANDYALFGLPTTVFISSGGLIVGRIIGQLHDGALRKALGEAFHVQIRS